MYIKADTVKNLTDTRWKKADELKNYDIWLVTVPSPYVFLDRVNWKFHPIWSWIVLFLFL